MRRHIVYTVKVMATIEEERTSGKEWKPIGQNEGGDQYGYTPEIQKTIRTEEEIYSQTVEQLDLAKLTSVVTQSLRKTRRRSKTS